MVIIYNLVLILYSITILYKVYKEAILSLKLSKIALFFIRYFIIFSIIYLLYTNNTLIATQNLVITISEVLFVNIIHQYITKLSEKLNNQIGDSLRYFVFFYCAPPIAIISMYINTFPDKLFISNCFISFAALVLILKYSISIVMTKEINKISLLHLLFLLPILMTGSIFSFANLNYSINIILNNTSAKITILDYVFLYSSIFTLNYNDLVLQIDIDKLIASISMIYSYFFISTVVATIINHLKDNNK